MVYSIYAKSTSDWFINIYYFALKTANICFVQVMNRNVAKDLAISSLLSGKFKLTCRNFNPVFKKKNRTTHLQQ